MPPKKSEGRCNAVTRSVSETKVKIAELQAQMDELKDMAEAERQAAEEAAQTAEQDNRDGRKPAQDGWELSTSSVTIQRLRLILRLVANH